MFIRIQRCFNNCRHFKIYIKFWDYFIFNLKWKFCDGLSWVLTFCWQIMILWSMNCTWLLIAIELDSWFQVEVNSFSRNKIKWKQSSFIETSASVILLFRDTFSEMIDKMKINRILYIKSEQTTMFVPYNYPFINISNFELKW